MCLPKPIVLLVMCVLLCVGSSWAGPYPLETVEASLSTLSTTTSPSDSNSESEIRPTESRRPDTKKSMSQSDSEGVMMSSRTSSGSFMSTSSDTNSEDSIVSTSSTRRSTSTGEVTTTIFVTRTMTNPSEGSDSTFITSTPSSDMNVTTTTTNVTTNSTTLSSHQTSLATSTTTSLLLNWTFPGNSSPQSNNSSAGGTHRQPGHCLAGSDCAWKLGVGLSFGSTFAVAIFFLISRRYRRSLDISHMEYHDNWDDRVAKSSAPDTPSEDQMALRTLDTSGTETRVTSLHDRAADELYLPEDEEGLVDRVADI